MIKQLWQDMFKSHVHLGSFLLRLGLASIFIFHGVLKVAQGGGKLWSDTLPEGTQLAVAWGETACGAALLVGLLSRLAAIGVIVIMGGAIALETGQLDFIHLGFIRGTTTNVPTGFEYNVAVIVMALAVLALGSGKVSLDYLFFGKPGAQQP